MLPTINPRKNTLSISLTESVLFLRSVDVSAHRSTTPENPPPSILRGLLILNLVKPTRISSIQVDLIGQSVTIWTEGPSTRYPAELEEKINLYSATRTFFRAPRVPTGRRALSLEPGLSHYADDAEFINRRRRPPSPSMARDPAPPHQLNIANIPRGRERARAHVSVDDYNLHPTPPLEVHAPTPGLGSPSPASSEDDYTIPPLHATVDRLHAHPVHISSRSALEQRSSTISPPPTIDSPYESQSLPRTSASVSHLSLPADSSRSPQHSSPAREGRRCSFDDHSVECSRSPSRGRMRARFSFASVSSSILEAVRSVQGASGQRGQLRQGGEGRNEDHSHLTPAPLYHVEEAVVLDGNEQDLEISGDGWQEFKKGTYTFPISFAIPSHVPPTLKCNYGTVSWRLKATVHRPGAFSPKLSAMREVILVASPSEDHRDDTDNVTIERFWEDQLQYILNLSGRVFPIGGTVPLTLNLLPMSKVKIFKVVVQLEERVDYFFAFSHLARRKDPDRRVELLSLVSKDDNAPLLPLPQVLTPETESTFHSLFTSDENLSEFMASLMGPGPWTLQMALTVPSAEGVLHFSNKNKGAPIEISHTLKVVVRVQRDDEQEVDPHTGKPKKFDITMRTPVHILSHLSNAQHTALPCYSEIGGPCPPAIQCASLGNREEPLRNSRRSVILQSQIGTGVFRPFVLPDGQSAEVDTLYERNMVFERLITGQQSEDGILPPAYCVEL